MEMIELQIHYNNIHNYISENYCYFNYDLKYYTEDFGESVAKTWTAIKHFFIKMWNKLINWIKGHFNKLIENYSKIFNDAQANWSKLKKKIEKEEFTNTKSFFKPIQFISKNKAGGTEENLLGLKFLDNEIFMDNEHEDFSNSNEKLKDIINNRFISSNKLIAKPLMKGEYTIKERIDSFLFNNNKYINFFRWYYALMSGMNKLSEEIFKLEDEDLQKFNEEVEKELPEKKAQLDKLNELSRALSNPNTTNIELQTLSKDAEKSGIKEISDKDMEKAVDYKNSSRFFNASAYFLDIITWKVKLGIDIHNRIFKDKIDYDLTEVFKNHKIEDLSSVHIKPMTLEFHNKTNANYKMINYLLNQTLMELNEVTSRVNAMNKALINFFKFLKENA